MAKTPEEIREEAKTSIHKFVDDWFEQQTRYMIESPADYESCVAGDWWLWFLESGGSL